MSAGQRRCASGDGTVGIGPRECCVAPDQSHRTRRRLRPGSGNRSAGQLDGQRQTPADHRQQKCNHDLSQESVLDDLVMVEPAQGMAGHDALGHLDSGKEYELACSQSRREPGGHIPPPRVATSLVPQATGQDPEDASNCKDWADESRRCPPLVPGIGKNRRATDRVRNGEKVCQAVTEQHSSRYEERQNSQPDQPPSRHSPHTSPTGDICTTTELPHGPPRIAQAQRPSGATGTAAPASAGCRGRESLRRPPPGGRTRTRRTRGRCRWRR